eukprot:TRINITY_DN40812_c0_g1_i1.p1 TRINITY_DN40812_c0_g1~~TRINITY_DN40812_c0_g1_i1.p1  ORF type:complete len:980 (-),score=133.53 TRINITY_DN40812_c0_g1_i1:287-3226(-)
MRATSASKKADPNARKQAQEPGMILKAAVNSYSDDGSARDAGAAGRRNSGAADGAAGNRRASASPSEHLAEGSTSASSQALKIRGSSSTPLASANEMRDTASSDAASSSQKRAQLDTLQMHLAELQAEDPARVFVARKVTAMGCRSKELLTEHYSQFGKVVRVMVSCSKVKPFKGTGARQRVRPGSLGFVVMDTPESVRKILSHGELQTVAGCQIQVERFEHTAKSASHSRQDRVPKAHHRHAPSAEGASRRGQFAAEPQVALAAPEGTGNSTVGAAGWSQVPSSSKAPTGLYATAYSQLLQLLLQTENIKAQAQAGRYQSWAAPEMQKLEAVLAAQQQQLHEMLERRRRAEAEQTSASLAAMLGMQQLYDRTGSAPPMEHAPLLPSHSMPAASTVPLAAVQSASEAWKLATVLRDARMRLQGLNDQCSRHIGMPQTADPATLVAAGVSKMRMPAIPQGTLAAPVASLHPHDLAAPVWAADHRQYLAPTAALLSASDASLHHHSRSASELTDLLLSLRQLEGAVAEAGAFLRGANAVAGTSPWLQLQGNDADSAMGALSTTVPSSSDGMAPHVKKDAAESVGQRAPQRVRPLSWPSAGTGGADSDGDNGMETSHSPSPQDVDSDPIQGSGFGDGSRVTVSRNNKRKKSAQKQSSQPNGVSHAKQASRRTVTVNPMSREGDLVSPEGSDLAVAEGQAGTEVSSVLSASGENDHGEDDDASWAMRPNARPTLGSHLTTLQEEDQDKVFIARRIASMGFRSQELLTEYFSQYGEVERVLVAHSTVRVSRRAARRIRPGSLGFVVMKDAEAVERILATGIDHTVAGVHKICVNRFEQASKLAEEGECDSNKQLSGEKLKRPAVDEKLNDMSTSESTAAGSNGHSQSNDSNDSNASSLSHGSSGSRDSNGSNDSNGSDKGSGSMDKASGSGDADSGSGSASAEKVSSGSSGSSGSEGSEGDGVRDGLPGRHRQSPPGLQEGATP